MQYRSDKYGNSLSILGFGCMRFERKLGAIEYAKAEAISEGRAAGMAEGRAAGMAEGRVAGMAEGRAESIRKMHAAGFSSEQICSILEISNDIVLDALK